MKKRLLVVDDEETLCEALRCYLEAEGFEVATAHCAEEALQMDIPAFDLILLDIMMGEMSGTELAARLRATPATASVPVIFCTALDSEDSMIEGFDIGADDYITKPYSMRNVVARVKAVLRRMESRTAPSTDANGSMVRFEGIEINTATKTCAVDGSPLRMPRKEFELLLFLITHPGRIYSREELLNNIWSEDVVVLDRVIDVNITRIRHKIGRYAKHIVSRSGYGYGFFE